MGARYLGSVACKHFCSIAARACGGLNGTPSCSVKVPCAPLALENEPRFRMSSRRSCVSHIIIYIGISASITST